LLPRNFEMVRAFAGDSTITSDLPFVAVVAARLAMQGLSRRDWPAGYLSWVARAGRERLAAPCDSPSNPRDSQAEQPARRRRIQEYGTSR